MEANDLENIVRGFAGIQKGERNQKAVSLMGSATRRKRFSDITNIVSSGTTERFDADDQETNAAVPVTSAKDYIAKLLKENTALLGLLGERNKIIEVTGMELQKLKISLQKANQQNWHLAQAHSLMLAELNLGKDRLKALGHELGCTTALLRAETLELEEEKNLNKQCKQLHEKTGFERRAADPSHLVNGKKTCDTNRKRTLRSRSLGPSTATHQETRKEKDEGRRSLRRSTRLKTDECEPTEDLFEIEDVKLPIRSHEDTSCKPESPGHSTPTDLVNSVKDEVHEDLKSVSPQCEDRGSHRHSLGRPQRRAAERVSSYREVPINVKMRRSD